MSSSLWKERKILNLMKRLKIDESEKKEDLREGAEQAYLKEKPIKKEEKEKKMKKHSKKHHNNNKKNIINMNISGNKVTVVHKY
uniref:DUF3362 domain-containing protein n=1 Tax=Strongyloides venezuelensis TaxID=75913 RepID=A0A0K0FRK2_STRVS